MYGRLLPSILIASAGHRSLHIKHAFPCAQAKQLSLSSLATPIFTSSFSIGRIAPVGQTLEHSIHNSQQPFRGISSGVSYAIIPRVIGIGTSPLVGHTFTHLLQRLQVARKSPSGIVPGGLRRGDEEKSTANILRVDKLIKPPATTAALSFKKLRRVLLVSASDI